MAFRPLQGYYAEVFMGVTEDYNILSNEYNGGSRVNGGAVDPVFPPDLFISDKEIPSADAFIVYANSWNLRLSIEKIQWDNTNKELSGGSRIVASDNPFYMRNYLYGFVGGEATISGVWNDDNDALIFGTSKRLRIGMEVSALLYHKPKRGYYISGVIQQCNIATDVTGLSSFTINVCVENFNTYVGM